MAYHNGSPVQLPDHLLPLARGTLEPEQNGEGNRDKLSKYLIVCNTEKTAQKIQINTRVTL